MGNKDSRLRIEINCFIVSVIEMSGKAYICLFIVVRNGQSYNNDKIRLINRTKHTN